MIYKLIFVNILTLIRVIGTIILVYIYKSYGGAVAGVLSLIFYLTDSLDGFLARKWHVSTFFGSLFDGMADKLFTIVNFIILYMITPYALIPIIFELLILLVQFIKYNNHLNIKSNIIGKSKVWVLAFIVVITFFVSDINNILIISDTLKNYILSIDNIFLYLMIPVVIMEFLTLFSYLFDMLKPKNIEIIESKKTIIKTKKLNKKEFKNYVKDIWFNPEFYAKHKNDANLKELKKLSKINR